MVDGRCSPSDCALSPQVLKQQGEYISPVAAKASPKPQLLLLLLTRFMRVTGTVVQL
jgi:hypothetical protein